MKKRTGWTFEGPVNRNGKRDCLDFRAYTIAGSYEEAARNIVWQYKVKFSLKKTDKVELDGLLYRVDKIPNIAEKKKTVEYDYDQLEMPL